MATTEPTITNKPTSDQALLLRKPRSLWSDARRRLLSSTVGLMGMTICAFLFAIAIITPIVQPLDQTLNRDTANKLQPPSWLMSQEERADAAKKSIDKARKDTPWGLFERPFGTDQLGRDIFIRVLHGAPISLTVGTFAVVLAVIFGSLLGLVSGFFGGIIDTITTWLMDILLAFPSILLAIALTAISNNRESFSYKFSQQITNLPILQTIFDPPLFNAMLAVAVIEVPIFGRIARAAVLSVRNQEYIHAAEAVGVSRIRMLMRHILPNSLTPILVQMTLSVASSITSVAALGFLGLGAQPPRPEWGSMLSTAREYVGTGQWWYALFPGIAIMLTVLGFNLLGDGLRDALDPRLKH
ncbi:ABC transporter permease [Herpetosiphon llansteffanensis]|uniref:ABC transporter permease n=1 Tax=Herpetosiphon llansteffanensis TaxID=2094568 RepID=UPI000D7C03B8|nr:ABC transporter permease [Herpetosiphon llansteffanensis]